MRKLNAVCLAAALVGAVLAARARAEPVQRGGAPLEEALKQHVAFLAGPDLHGRGAWEDRKKAAEYVAKGFESAGFKPLPGRSTYFVDHGGTPEQPEIRNVCAWWPEPPKSAAAVGEYVVLSAHYDHLGVKGDAMHPGADDNASGVAVLIEAAKSFTGREALVLRTKPLPRAFCLVAFDLEEKGLAGSRAFVADPPVPLSKCALFLTMDQMGRSLADVQPGLLFLMGGEHCAWLERTLTKLTVASDVRPAVLGIDFQPPTGESDYVPFQEKKVPFLFVSTGASSDYHRPGDTPDRLDYARMVEHVTYVRDLVTLALASEEPLAWRDEVTPRVAEIQTVLDIVKLSEAKLEDLGAPETIREMVTSFRTSLEGIVAKGSVTEAERKVVRNTARMLFVQAVSLLGGSKTSTPR